MAANFFLGLSVPSIPWHARIPAPPSGIHGFVAADLHLTIAFLGAVGEARALAAWAALAWPLPRTVVGLGAVVPMGGSPAMPGSYSALSALLVPGKAANAVAAAMGESRARAFAAAGIEGDARPPKPHVTLARPGRRASAREREEGLAWAAALALGGAPVELSVVVLYTAYARDGATEGGAPRAAGGARLFQAVRATFCT